MTQERNLVAQAAADNERAQIVAWLRGFHWTHRSKDAADRLAQAIQDGEHWK